MLGLVVFPYFTRTLTRTTGSLTGVRDNSYACYIYTHGGWAHRQRVSTTFSTRKNAFFSCAPDTGGVRTGVVFHLESTALPTEPPRHPRKRAWACLTAGSATLFGARARYTYWQQGGHATTNKEVSQAGAPRCTPPTRTLPTWHERSDTTNKEGGPSSLCPVLYATNKNTSNLARTIGHDEQGGPSSWCPVLYATNKNTSNLARTIEILLERNTLIDTILPSSGWAQEPLKTTPAAVVFLDYLSIYLFIVGLL